MPRVTRAQAEVESLLHDLLIYLRRDGELLAQRTQDECFQDVASRLRAYLAQRPDEDTVRKGHECLGRIHLRLTTGEYMMPDPQIDAVRAAMHQPEEEAR